MGRGEVLSCPNECDHAAHSCAALARGGASDRAHNRCHAARGGTCGGAGGLVQGDFVGTTARLEAIAAEHPRDILAQKLGQYRRFYSGESKRMHDVLARALPAWDARVAGYGFVLGCHAFGLEETGDYAAAERAGREAIVPGRFRNHGLSCRGTKSSNPVPSSGESGANLSLARIRLRTSRSRGFPRVCGLERAARSTETRKVQQHRAEER